MLLYKLGRNIMHKKRTLETNLKLGIQTEKDCFDDADDEEGAANRALNNCLKLLDHQKYPQIAASASYLLADIMIPDDLNPLDPKFIKIPAEETTKSKKKQSKKNKKNKKKAKQQQKQPNESFVSVDELRRDSISPDSEPSHKPAEDEGLPQDVETRCSMALQHICDGLKSAQILKTKKIDMEEKQRKAREQHERDNPKMCKPMEPIPMPYKDDTKAQEIVEFREKKPYDWHDELIALLLRKAFLVYITFSELKFNQQDFGTCTKSLKRALNCYFALSQVGLNLAKSKNVKILLAFSQGVAADAYVKLVERWEEFYIQFVENFNGEGTESDQNIAQVIENYVDESQREWDLKVPKDTEEGLLLALKCFKSSLGVYETLPEYEIDEEFRDIKGTCDSFSCFP